MKPRPFYVRWYRGWRCFFGLVRRDYDIRTSWKVVGYLWEAERQGVRL